MSMAWTALSVLAMAAAGVAGVLGPGASADEVVACIRAAADTRS